MDGPEKIVQEGSAVLSIKDDVFYSERQILQRDLSVAVLRAFRKTRISSDFPPRAVKEERSPEVPNTGEGCLPLESGNSMDSRVSPAETVLKVCDALAGGGVRAIRYSLEAGPVHVVANDHSKKSCQAVLRNARLSGIDPHKAPAPRLERSDVDPVQRSGDNFNAIRSSPTKACTNHRDRDSNPDSDSNYNFNTCVRSSSPSGTSIRNAADQSAVSRDRPIGDATFSSPGAPSSVGSFLVRVGDANAIMRYGAEGIPPPELHEASAGEIRGDADTSPVWDLIDVDPFGSCLPFLEAAMAGARDGGLLAVAATDMAVLCGKKGSQKCRSQYRASVADRPFSKEAAIRVLLHRMDVLARQRARRIKPLLCVALDYYVRLFVTVLPSGDGSDPHQPLFVAQQVDSPEFRVVPPFRREEKEEEEEDVRDSRNVPGNSPAKKAPEGGLVTDCSCCSHSCHHSRLLEAAPRRKGHGVGTDTAAVPAAQGVGGCPRCVMTLGPFWRGPLFEPTFVNAIIEEVKYSRNARRERHHKMGSTPKEGVGMRGPLNCPKTLVETPRISDTSRQEMVDFETEDPSQGDANKEDGGTLSVGGPLNLASRGQLLFLLEAIARELVECPLFYSLTDVAAANVGGRGRRSSGGGKMPRLPRVEAVWEELRSAGYECSGSHAEPRSIKTLAPLQEVQAAVLRATAKARGRVGEQLVDEGQERHSQKGSLRGARARIEREVGKKKLNHNATTVEDMGEDRGGHDGVGGGQTRGGTEAGPRVQVGCSPLPILHALVSSSSPGCAVAGHDAAASVQGTSFPPHLTLASLEGFLENSLAFEPTRGDVDRDSEDVTHECDRRDGCRSGSPTAGARFICVRAQRQNLGTSGARCRAGSAAVETGRRAEEPSAGEEIALEQLLSARWPKEVAFCDSLREACASAVSQRSPERYPERYPERSTEDVEPCATVLVLGGRHDLGGGLRLAMEGMRVVGVKGSDGRLPLLEGRQGSHAITCAASGVSLRSLHIRAGSFAPVPPAMLLPTVISAPAKGFQGDLKADGRGDVEVPLADRALVSRESGGVREGGLVRKRPRLIFDRAAAQAVMATTAAAATGATASAGKTRNGLNKRRRHGGNKREPPAHAISVEGGTAIVSGCDVSSSLPYACVCVSGASTSASLVDGTRVSDGSGMGLLVCGKGEASVSGCSFEALGAAGVEARSGSRVTLSECVVSGSGRSGVFVQGFASALLKRCDVLGSSLAGVEALRNASLSMDACRVVGSRRGGVLVHGASGATLRDCDVSGSSLAGVDVRTGAEATLEACVIRDGKTSGIYVSAGGNISVSSTLLRSNRLAALEVNRQHQSRREVRDAFDGDRNPLAAAVADTIDNCGVSIGAGNVMLGNGLDGVMHTGGGGERGGQ